MSETPGQNPLGETSVEPATKAKRPQTLGVSNLSSRPGGGSDLERRVAALEAKPKRVPPKPRRPLPWPRAAVQIAWIISVTMVILFLIMFMGLAYLADTLPLLSW